MFKSKLRRDGADLLAAKMAIYDVMLSTVFGSSLACMTPEGAERVKAELGRRLKMVAAQLLQIMQPSEPIPLRTCG